MTPLFMIFLLQKSTMVLQFINEILSKLNFFFSKTLASIQQKPDVEKYKMPSTYLHIKDCPTNAFLGLYNNDFDRIQRVKIIVVRHFVTFYMTLTTFWPFSKIPSQKLLTIASSFSCFLLRRIRKFGMFYIKRIVFANAC